MEKAGYILLGIIALVWILAVIIGSIAVFPVGLVGLIMIVGIGLLMIKVIQDRINNKEDDYYQKNIEK
ncbi:MAG: hypothetical protein JXQ65_16800 [Candidatus Marinimicrobia bacterium]|nr:hypothetical protein [Candidatus Neomarinimicrobiota bacterium]